MKLNRELCASRRKLSQQAGWTIAFGCCLTIWYCDSFWMLSDYMVLSLYNFHEHSEFTSIFTSTLTSETSVINIIRS